MSERKREYEEEASSTSVSPVKKTKRDDSDSSSDSHDVVVIAASSYSFTSSADSATDECSEDQSSSISSGCFNSDPTFVTDLEVHQGSERETKTTTLITTNFREETSPVSEGLGETTTEIESSSSSPTPREIEEFISELEKEYDDKQKRFKEKYNFDIVNDEPLEGRYKWDQLKP